MEESTIISLVSSVGVPAVISFYVLARVARAMDDLTLAINRLLVHIDIDRRRRLP